jgi:hypothetical protein
MDRIGAIECNNSLHRGNHTLRAVWVTRSVRELQVIAQKRPKYRLNALAYVAFHQQQVRLRQDTAGANGIRAPLEPRENVNPVILERPAMARAALSLEESVVHRRNYAVCRSDRRRRPANPSARMRW